MRTMTWPMRTEGMILKTYFGQEGKSEVNCGGKLIVGFEGSSQLTGQIPTLGFHIWSYQLNLINKHFFVRGDWGCSERRRERTKELSKLGSNDSRNGDKNDYDAADMNTKSAQLPTWELSLGSDDSWDSDESDATNAYMITKLHHVKQNSTLEVILGQLNSTGTEWTLNHEIRFGILT